MDYSSLVFLVIGTFTLTVVHGDQCLNQGSDCLKGLEQMAGAMKDTTVMCTKIDEVINCVNNAIKKCSSQEIKDNLAVGLKSVEQQKQTYCSMCSVTQVQKCMPDSQSVTIAYNRSEEMCKFIVKSKQCFEKLKNDCKEKDANFLNIIEQQLKAFDTIHQDCSKSQGTAQKGSAQKGSDSAAATVSWSMTIMLFAALHFLTADLL